MPRWLEVRTQHELDRALSVHDVIPMCAGDERFVVTGSGIVRAVDAVTILATESARVEAAGDATVEARDTATVAAWDSVTIKANDHASVAAGSNTTIEATGSARVRAQNRANVLASDMAIVSAGGRAVVGASGSATVRAFRAATVRASETATVECWDSASIEASDSATVRAAGRVKVTAAGSARVEAWDTVRVSAEGRATVKAWGATLIAARGSAAVEAARHVKVTHPDDNPGHFGGRRRVAPQLKTAAEWCEFYGVEMKSGVATLYKAVDAAFSSCYGQSYQPGSSPVAADWDGGREECGGGLHLSPRPFFALRFAPHAARFVACPVRTDDIVVHEQPHYPSKVKARAVCAPIYEVDAFGLPVNIKG
jgi:hypothetical protein